MATVTRNLVFGIQDGVVTTIGLMAGMSLSSTPRMYVIQFVALSVFVSSISMAIGSYQSERVASNFNTDTNRLDMLLGAVTMFVSYMGAGLLVMIPYFVTDPKYTIIMAAFIASLMLFVSGYYTALVADKDEINEQLHGVETMVLGLVAMMFGFASGRVATYIKTKQTYKKIQRNNQ